MKTSPPKIKFHHLFHGDLQKPLILFLHGFLGSGNDWIEVIKFLSPHYNCLTLDMPGHGETKLIANSNNSFEGTASALIGFLDQQKIRKCYLTGYSMGGRIALFLSLRYPNYFSKIVLESASPGLHTEKERNERIFQDEKIAQDLESRSFNSFLKKWYSQPIFKGLTDHKNFNQLLQRREKSDFGELAKSLRFLGAGKQPSLWEEINQNKIPILLITGEDDVKFQSIAHEMLKLNEFIQVKVIENCSHNVHFQKPKEFANQLNQFFGS
jgi:2-succinyl-6-hydroxy-2,4-cyclohexadiene-1-carboxylate synthase